LAGAVSDLCAQINRENYNAVEYRSWIRPLPRKSTPLFPATVSRR
jgi:hypothetical protein